jgi:hypothetical protein
MTETRSRMVGWRGPGRHLEHGLCLRDAAHLGVFPAICLVKGTARAERALIQRPLVSPADRAPPFYGAEPLLTGRGKSKY